MNLEKQATHWWTEIHHQVSQEFVLQKDTVTMLMENPQEFSRSVRESPDHTNILPTVPGRSHLCLVLDLLLSSVALMDSNRYEMLRGEYVW